MSATISLKKPMARSHNVALDLIQFVLAIAAFLFFVGMAHLFLTRQGALEAQQQEPAGTMAAPAASALAAATFTAETLVQPAPRAQNQSEAVPLTTAPVLSPQMQNALTYVQRRYKVSPEALIPVFEVAQMIGTERRIDPLLILSIIAIESRFNPFAESSMGAKGLMQVIPRFQQAVAAAGLQAKQVGSYRNLASHGSGLRFARVGATADDWRQAFATRNLAPLMTTIAWFEIVAP